MKSENSSHFKNARFFHSTLWSKSTLAFTFNLIFPLSLYLKYNKQRKKSNVNRTKQNKSMLTINLKKNMSFRNKAGLQCAILYHSEKDEKICCECFCCSPWPQILISLTSNALPCNVWGGGKLPESSSQLFGIFIYSFCLFLTTKWYICSLLPLLALNRLLQCFQTVVTLVVLADFDI